MSWEKITEKLYTIRINDELKDIKVPYAKVEKLFQSFVGEGGLISAEGIVQTDIIAMVSKFSAVGDILLSTYGPRGEVIEQGDCGQLSTAEIFGLFEIATDVIEGFIVTISTMKAAGEKVQDVKAAKEKSKKTA